MYGDSCPGCLTTPTPCTTADAKKRALIATAHLEAAEFIHEEQSELREEDLSVAAPLD